MTAHARCVATTLDDRRATVLLSTSAPAIAARTNTRVTSDDLHALFERRDRHGLAIIQRAAAREVRSSIGDRQRRNHFGRLHWKTGVLLGHLDRLASARARPLDVRLAEARAALGLTGGNHDAVTASLPTQRYGPNEREVRATIPPSAPPRERVPDAVIRGRARQLRRAMTGEADPQHARQRAKAVKQHMTGAAGQEGARSAAKAISARMHDQVDEEVRQRAAGVRAALLGR
jgi:hypothetical protein